jgi:hypothetical protein
MAPKSIMTMDITVAKTGLLMLKLDMLIYLFIDLEIWRFSDLEI